MPLRLISALRCTLSLGLVMDGNRKHGQPVRDEYVIDANHLEVYEGRQIGSGAFAKVFLGELRGPKCMTRCGGLQRTGQPTKVAVKQTLLATEDSR